MTSSGRSLQAEVARALPACQQQQQQQQTRVHRELGPPPTAKERRHRSLAATRTRASSSRQRQLPSLNRPPHSHRPPQNRRSPRLRLRRRRGCLQRQLRSPRPLPWRPRRLLPPLRRTVGPRGVVEGFLVMMWMMMHYLGAAVAPRAAAAAAAASPRQPSRRRVVSSGMTTTTTAQGSSEGRPVRGLVQARGAHQLLLGPSLLSPTSLAAATTTAGLLSLLHQSLQPPRHNRPLRLRSTSCPHLPPRPMALLPRKLPQQ